MISLKKTLLVAGALMLSAAGLQAQVATPYFHPGMANSAGTATMWRMHSVVSVRASSGSGDVNYTAMGGEGEMKQESTAFLGAFAGDSSLAFEAAMANVSIATDLDSGVTFDRTINMTDVFATWRMSDSFGLAVEVGFTEVDNEFNGSPAGDGITETTGIGLGWRAFEPLFLSFGQREITSNGSNGPQDLETNNYSENFYGVAFLAGDPKSNLFKLEYSKTWNGESRKDADVAVGTAENHVNESDTAKITAEARLGAWGILYDQSKTSTKPLSWTGGNDSEETNTKIGLAWTNDTLVIGVASYQNESEDGADSMDVKGYILNVGYLF